ncbi:MAG TPA: peptide deformylase [Clostridiales bacterium]|nr:peptide deformylase [Clostridiales bacterium]
MATRTILEGDNPRLRKEARPVKKINQHIIDLLDDMGQTLYDARGVGLAAPQVGALRRIVVIDVGEGLIELINPEVIEEEGQQRAEEGCLSVPGVDGIVIRPEKVKVRAMDRNGDIKEYEGEGLLARAFSHEIDHLNGVLFTDKMIERVYHDEDEDEEDEGL